MTPRGAAFPVALVHFIAFCHIIALHIMLLLYFFLLPDMYVSDKSCKTNLIN